MVLVLADKRSMTKYLPILIILSKVTSLQCFPHSTSPFFQRGTSSAWNKKQFPSPYRVTRQSRRCCIKAIFGSFASSKLSFSRDRYTSKKVPLHKPIIQVISDIDDTIKSSGGVEVGGIALGGIDTQYERGDFYPGVFQFMMEISSHRLNLGDENPQDAAFDSKPPPIPPLKVAVLTARAEEFRAALELKPSSKLVVAFQKAGETIGFPDWGIGPVLYGSVAEWVVQDRKGLRKFTNFERLMEQGRELNPNSKDLPGAGALEYIYVGDTGERDQEAGETMLREYPELVRAVFLHAVAYKEWPVATPPSKLINGRPVVFFRTYVGAALKAVQIGLIDTDALDRVIASAESDIGHIPLTDTRWIDLNFDIKKARQFFKINPRLV